MTANSKRAVRLTMLAVLLVALFGYVGVSKMGSATDVALVGDLRAKLPFYARWVYARNRYPWLIRRLDAADRRNFWRRSDATRKLASMGTNAWPVVPMLVESLGDSNSEVAIAAGLVLAQINAQAHPEWKRLEKRLDGNSRATLVFNYLISERNRFGGQKDDAYRRFALIGLAAVGPTAGKSTPSVMSVLKFKEDHELWGLATVALRRIGGNLNEVVSFQKAVLRDNEEWPSIRAAAGRALVLAAPNDPETDQLLRQALHDEKAEVRLMAARELWRLDRLAEEVLPTLTALRDHKRLTIRTGAMDVMKEMGRQ